MDEQGVLEEFANHDKRLDGQAKLISDLTVKVNSLMNKVADLEANQPAVSERTANSKEFEKEIIALVIKANGFKLNSGTIASNMSGNRETSHVSAKLQSMAKRGLIQTDKLGGRAAMYWIDAK